jgi:hypothetical protein
MQVCFKIPAFNVGDMVTVSESMLPLRAASTHSVKLQQHYMGPYAVVEAVNPGASLGFACSLQSGS